MSSYPEFHRRSIQDRDGFWREQAAMIDWQTPFTEVCDYSRPPFAKWFVGGRTNLCFNAVDRHLQERGDQLALVVASSETDSVRELTFRQLHREVNAFAAALCSLGVEKGDRVVVYMPHTVDAAIAMLACARIGAVHSVVFGGFAAHNLALRIDDARPRVLVCADAGIRGGNVIPFKPLVDQALARAQHPPAHVLVVNRALAAELPLQPGRDLEYGPLAAQHADAVAQGHRADDCAGCRGRLSVLRRADLAQRGLRPHRAGGRAEPPHHLCPSPTLPAFAATGQQ